MINAEDENEGYKFWNGSICTKAEWAMNSALVKI